MDEKDLLISQYKKEIEILEEKIKQMSNDIKSLESLDFGWTGNLGRWYWNYEKNEVSFNPLKVLALGYQVDNMPEKVDYGFFTNRLHKDDYEMVMQNMKDHLMGKRNAYEVEYRIRKEDGSYVWFYDRGVITKRDANNKPVLISGIVFDITKKKQIEEDLRNKNKYLEELALKDPLTGTFNHRSLYNQLNDFVSKKKPFKELHVVMFDLDNFKRVNDTYGHLFGDKVLKTFSDMITKNKPKDWIFGRYGGEEFMLICTNHTIEEVTKVLNVIRNKFNAFYSKKQIIMSFSAGIQTYTNQSLYELIEQADQKLYDAKANGKNQIIY